jgi:hypothetical protein
MVNEQKISARHVPHRSRAAVFGLLPRGDCGDSVVNAEKRISGSDFENIISGSIAPIPRF